MDLSLIAAASQSLSVIRTLTEGLVSVRDEAKLQQVRMDMLGKVIDVMGALQTLQLEYQREFEAHAATRAELQKAQERLAERAKVELHEVYPGCYVYATTRDAAGKLKPPFLCQSCYDKGTTSILRMQEETAYEPAHLNCRENSAHSLKLGKDKPLPHPFRGDSHSPI